MLKILQARLQQYVNWELPDVQTGFREGRGTRDQIANICWIIEKAREFQKNICFVDYTKAFDCGSQQTVENSRDGNTRPPYLPPVEPVWFKVKKQQLEPDMEQQTGSKLGRVHQGCIVYCHPAYLTSMQSTSCKMPDWMKHKLESRLLGEISITSDMQVITPLWHKAERS